MLMKKGKFTEAQIINKTIY